MSISPRPASFEQGAKLVQLPKGPMRDAGPIKSITKIHRGIHLTLSHQYPSGAVLRRAPTPPNILAVLVSILSVGQVVGLMVCWLLCQMVRQTMGQVVRGSRGLESWTDGKSGRLSTSLRNAAAEQGRAFVHGCLEGLRSNREALTVKVFINVPEHIPILDII